MSSSDGAVVLVTALACGRAPVAAGAGAAMDAAAAGVWMEIVFATRRSTEVSAAAGALTEAATPGRAVDVLAAGGGATGDADVAYRESAAVPSPASSTHSSAAPVRRSVREPASRPGFFDESGAPRVMAHNRWRGRTDPAHQRLHALNGGPGTKPPLRPCSPAHASLALDAFATVRRRLLGETCRVARASTIVSSVRSTLGLSPCAHSTRMQT